MIKGMAPAKNGGYRCPVEICKAACCRAMSFRPDKPGPCEFVTDGHECKLHLIGGLACKPLGCVQYPKDQADIDAMNEKLEAAGIAERCQLEF